MLSVLLQIRDTYSQGVFPIRDSEPEGGLDFGFVKDGIVRAVHLTGELVAVAWADVALGTGKFADFTGKVVP